MLNGQENALILMKDFPQTKDVFKKFGIKPSKTKDTSVNKLAALAIKHKIPLQILLNHLAKATNQEVEWPKVKGLNEKSQQTQNSFSASTTLRQGNIPGVKKIIAVHSGKGGVGKTFIAVNLALYLAKKNFRIGLIDLDIDCPNIMKVLELKGKLHANADKKIVPLEKFKIKIISMAAIQKTSDQAILWRGPIIAKAVEQLLYDTAWGEIDLLIADLPPGTGDVPITLLNLLQLEGILFVTTPQELAILDAFKSVNMAKSFGIKTIGLIENMTGHVFGKPKTKSLALARKIKYLGNIPLKKKYNSFDFDLMTKDPILKKIFEQVKNNLNLIDL